MLIEAKKMDSINRIVFGLYTNIDAIICKSTIPIILSQNTHYLYKYHPDYKSQQHTFLSWLLQ